MCLTVGFAQFEHLQLLGVLSSELQIIRFSSGIKSCTGCTISTGTVTAGGVGHTGTFGRDAQPASARLEATIKTVKLSICFFIVFSLFGYGSLTGLHLRTCCLQRDQDGKSTVLGILGHAGLVLLVLGAQRVVGEHGAYTQSNRKGCAV